MLLQRFGAGWEYTKVAGLALWPVRLIILVNLAMLGIFCLAQAQDALFGAVIGGETAAAGTGGQRPFWLLLAVTFWAVQSWYWARLLLDLPPTGLTLNYYTSRRCRVRVYRCLRVIVPRFLGCAVFVVVGIFIWLSASYPAAAEAAGILWLVVYLAAAALFYLFTTARRAVLSGAKLTDTKSLWRRGHKIRRPPHPALRAALATRQRAILPPDVEAALRVSRWFGLLWLILLILTMLSALSPLSDTQRLAGSNILILVLGVASLWTIWALDYRRGRKIFLSLLIFLDVGVFLISINWPAWAGMLCKPAVILMLVAGVWVGATSFFLALPGHKLGLPVGSMLLIGMIFFSALPSWLSHPRGDYDNHAVRSVAGEVPADRQTLLDAFDRWKVCANGQTDCTKKKMIIVTIEGGASRSAYWSAMILGALEDSVPDFHQSVFAISSVSGGSLGAAVYQRLLAAAGSGKPRCGPKDSYMLCAASILEEDYLGADFLSMFDSDLLQRLLPGNLLPDRAYAMETAWERAWFATMKTDDFTGALKLRRKSAAAEPAKWLPVLLLNGTSVKTGHRIITSDVALDDGCKTSTPDETKDPPWPLGNIPSAVDFFCLTRELIPLSTAVHNSARFPYVSPAGTLWARDGDGNSWKADRIVDGGYFETLGGVTVSDLLRLLRKDGKLDGIDVTVIAFENDPNGNEAYCDPGLDCTAKKAVNEVGREADTMNFTMRNANDVLAPAIGLATSRTGRGDYAADMLEAQLKDEKRQANNYPFVRVNLLDEPDPSRIDPAMSWYLSPRSIADMQRDVCDSDTIGRSLNRLGALLPTPSATLAADVRADIGCK